MFLIPIIVFLLRIYSKLTAGICRCSSQLVGKVVIITGGNAGIGFETAKDLAERGAKVILACRNEELGLAAARRIVELTGNSNVHCRLLNLASLKSVREFAKQILESESRLDILINNAGAVYLNKQKTEDGLLIEMQTNHFGPFLLTNLLLPLLKSSAPSRIINVSSAAHNFGHLDFSDLNMEKVPEKKKTDFQVYGNTKQCNILMTVELSRRLEGTGVTANSLHPGLVSTDIMKNCNSFFTRMFFKFMMKIGKSVWEGAQTSIYLAVSPELKDVSGQYFSDCKLKEASVLSTDPILARNLWEKSELLVQLK